MREELKKQEKSLREGLAVWKGPHDAVVSRTQIQSFHDHAYSFTRRTCAAAATTILHQFNRVKLTDMVKLWTISTFTIGAAIILYLDILYDDAGFELREHDLNLVLETISGFARIGTKYPASPLGALRPFISWDRWENIRYILKHPGRQVTPPNTDSKALVRWCEM